MAKGKYQKWLEPDALILLEGWARYGLTDKQIAHNMGITEQTLNVWKNKYPSLSESLKKGKEVVDIMVENALLKRALGYDYDETRIELYPDGSRKKVVSKKHVVPDVTAQIFWLKNRKPDMYRDKAKDSSDIKEQEARIERLKADTEHIKKSDGVETNDDDGVILVHRGGEDYETDDSS